MDEVAVYRARLELVDFLVEVFWDVPTEEFIEDLLGDDVALPDQSVTERMDRGFEMLADWREQNRGRPVEELTDELNKEYTRLFVGPRPPVHPHETYYREDTDFRGKGVAEVEASYSGAGWAPPEGYPEESDHIAVELAFLRYLIERQRQGHEETFGFERVFLDEHLLRWADPFVEETEEAADDGLFLAGALIFGGLVSFEDELVAQMV